jgi:hypothetical protein
LLHATHFICVSVCISLASALNRLLVRASRRVRVPPAVTMPAGFFRGEVGDPEIHARVQVTRFCELGLRSISQRPIAGRLNWLEYACKREPMTPLTPAERNALRLRAEKADEVFSGRTVGELILDLRKAHTDASAGLLGAALDAILAQCIAEPFEPWPGSLVAALVAP